MYQGCTNSGPQVAIASEFCTVASNICGSSVWYMLQVTHLVRSTLRWFLDLWKMCAHLRCTIQYTLSSRFVKGHDISRMKRASSQRNVKAIRILFCFFGGRIHRVRNTLNYYI
jgi:hypothetical protein